MFEKIVNICNKFSNLLDQPHATAISFSIIGLSCFICSAAAIAQQ